MVSGAIQEKEYCPIQHLGVVAIKKGAFGSPSTTVGQFTYTFLFLVTLNYAIFN